LGITALDYLRPNLFSQSISKATYFNPGLSLSPGQGGLQMNLGNAELKYSNSWKIKKKISDLKNQANDIKV